MTLGSILILVCLLIVTATMLYIFYKWSGLDEFFKEREKRLKRLIQLMWELKQTEVIIGIMYDEGAIDKMTTAQRKELIKLLAKEYPLWYEVYGKHYNA